MASEALAFTPPTSPSMPSTLMTNLLAQELTGDSIEGTLAEPQGLHQVMLGLPSRVSLPTAEASLEVAASRALEAPLLAPQLQQTGTGTQWLEDNSLGGGKAPPWIATMADDIALATSFWR